MEKEQSNEIILRTYGSVWNIERKLYSLDGFRLPVPIVMNECIYLAVSLVITLILMKIFPFVNNLNWTMKWLVIPIGTMKALTTIKLDGKLAHKFLYDYIIFVFSPKQYARFKPIKQLGKKKICFDYMVLFRKHVIMNKTDLAMKSDSRR